MKRGPDCALRKLTSVTGAGLVLCLRQGSVWRGHVRRWLLGRHGIWAGPGRAEIMLIFGDGGQGFPEQSQQRGCDTTRSGLPEKMQLHLNSR